MKKESNTNNERFVVNLFPSAKFFFVSFLFMDTLCVILLLMFIFFPEDITLLEKIIFIPLIFLMLIGFIFFGIIFIRTRIVVDGDEFIYYPTFRRKQIYSFLQITKITFKERYYSTYTIYTDKKLLSMGQYATKNHQLFIHKCVQQNIPIENIPKKQCKK